MLPDRVSNPGPLTYKSGALPIALRGPAYRSLGSTFHGSLILTYLEHYLEDSHHIIDTCSVLHCK